MTAGDPTPSPFDRAAPRFGELGEHLWRPLGEALVARAAPRLGEWVLDACCGAGASAIPAARSVGPGGRVDAVDTAGALLAQLERDAELLPQLQPRRADVLAGGGDGYDLVQCGLGVFFFPDMQDGTERLVSRARRGGRVALSIWRERSMREPAEHLRDAWAATTGEEPEPRKPHLVDRIGQPDAFEDWLGDLGLRDVCVTLHEHRLPVAPELAWLVVTGSGFVSVLADLSAEQVEEVRRRYLEGFARAGTTTIDATVLIGVGTRQG